VRMMLILLISIICRVEFPDRFFAHNDTLFPNRYKAIKLPTGLPLHPPRNTSWDSVLETQLLPQNPPWTPLLQTFHINVENFSPPQTTGL
jgi:hypothetical protein